MAVPTVLMVVLRDALMVLTVLMVVLTVLRDVLVVLSMKETPPAACVDSSSICWAWARMVVA